MRKILTIVLCILLVLTGLGLVNIDGLTSFEKYALNISNACENFNLSLKALADSIKNMLKMFNNPISSIGAVFSILLTLIKFIVVEVINVISLIGAILNVNVSLRTYDYYFNLFKSVGVNIVGKFTLPKLF